MQIELSGEAVDVLKREAAENTAYTGMKPDEAYKACAQGMILHAAWAMKLIKDQERVKPARGGPNSRST